MSITSNPTHQARATRGTGNTGFNGKAMQWEPSCNGKTGTYYWVDGRYVHESETTYRPNAWHDTSNINVKHYDHYNRSIGKYISSKAQYDNEMARGNYIPQDKADDIAKNVQDKKTNNYKLQEGTMDLITSAKPKSDGTIELSDRAKDAYIAKKGSSNPRAPKGTPLEGGYE